jgi:hypothetical protein
MSGGAAVKAGGGVEGDRPVCTNPGLDPGEEDRGYAPPASSKGLGLDRPGGAAPYYLKTRATPAGRSPLFA